MALVLARFSIALAHATLLLAAPTPNGFYPADDPPTQVTLTFSEEVITAFAAIRILNQAGEAVDNGDVRIANPERTALTVSLKPLPTGLYTVAWKVISAIDGHSTSGSYVFGVGVFPASQPITTAPRWSLASLGARWLTLTGQVLLLGLFVFRLFVWRPALNPDSDEDAQLDLAMARRAIRVGWVGLGLVGFGLLLTLIAQRDAIGDVTLASAQAWLSTQFGGMWAIRFWLSVGLAFGLADLTLGVREGRSGLKGWDWWAGLVLSTVLGLTITLTSHSAALPESQWLAVVSDGAHLLAAGAWVGGLVQLVIAARLIHTLPDAGRAHHLLPLVLNFSTVAAIAVGALLVSGTYLAVQHIGTWAALLKTTYGLTLLAKTGLALPAFAIASVNLLVVKPRLAVENNPQSARLHRRFYRLVLAEAGFALAVIAAAGFLTDFQRGRDAVQMAEQSQMVVSQSADDLHVTLTIEPALWAQESVFDVYMLDADNQPVPNAREVSLRFTFMDKDLGTNEVTAESTNDGHYRATGGFLSLGGVWEVKIVVRRANAFDTFLPFQVDTGRDGIIRPLSGSALLADRLTEWFKRAGGWLTGGVLLLFALAWVIPAVQAAQGKVGPALGVLLLPSLLGLWFGILQTVSALKGELVAPSGDPRALALLAESDATMNRLASVQLSRTTRGDDESGLVVTETIAFQAPNLFYDRLSNGSENMADGATYYYRREGETLWQAVRQNEPFKFPDFDQAPQAISARLGKVEEVNGRRAQIVTYTVYILRNPVAFTRWIDLETEWILQEYMDAPGHHMLSVYSAFNEPVTITLPTPSEIGPTPTVISP
ncbi:MAG: CopD family protein [Anaerolineales bacterium]